MKPLVELTKEAEALNISLSHTFLELSRVLALTQAGYGEKGLLQLCKALPIGIGRARALAKAHRIRVDTKIPKPLLVDLGWEKYVLLTKHDKLVGTVKAVKTKIAMYKAMTLQEVKADCTGTRMHTFSVKLTTDNHKRLCKLLMKYGAGWSGSRLSNGGEALSNLVAHVESC